MSEEGTSFFREAVQPSNRFLLRLAAIAAIGGFLFGYDTGIVSGALLYIKQDLGGSNFEQQAVVGSLLLGAVVGAAISGYTADAFSRRSTKIVSGSIYVLGALASAFSQDITQLIIARFVLGISVGTASFVSPMYISEMAPKRIRGGTTSFNQLMIVSGILGAYIASFALKGVANEWRWMLGLGALPGLALAIGMFTVPNTPRWLIEKGRRDEAGEVLRKVREEEDIEDELDEIEETSREEGGLRDIFRSSARPMLLVGIALAAFQQLIGVNTVIYYAPTILQSTGVTTSSAITQTVFIGVTNVVFTVLAISLLDRLGRRFFLLAGTIGCIVSLGALGIYFAIPAVADHAGWLAAVALVTYIASFAVGLGPVFWLMISEIFPLRMRGPAMAACTVVNWAFNFLISFTFLSLTSAITKQGTFWLYAGFGLVALTIFAMRVPETKGRSLEEIETELVDA